MGGQKTSTAGLFRRSLSDLPDDLLEPIAGYLHYLDIANLTFVGCKALNGKLARGGVSQLSVRFVPSPKPFSWPSIWTHLTQLSKLTLSNFRLDAKLVMTSNWLRLLPKTLKEIRCDFAGTFSALQPLLCKNPNFFPALEVLKILIGLKDTFIYGVVPVWPPNLLRLTLDSIVLHNMPLYLSSLPKSLTSLRGNFTDIRDASSETFPASLTSIRLSVQNLDCGVVPLLPVGLKRLILAGGYDAQQTWDERHAEMDKWKNSTAQLPRGLTELNWTVDIYNGELIQNLPPNLETLRGGLIDPTLWHLLPDSITSCSACSIASNPAGREVVEHVPKNLARLSLTVSALPHFKTNLKSGVTVMAVRAFDGLKEEMSALNMERLNSSITTLLCYVPLEDALVKVLPSNLTTLWLGFNEIRGEQVAMLPRTLKRLHLLKGDLEERTGAFFPPQLTHLTVARMKPSSWFPRTLRHLQVNSGADLPLEALQDLPPGLQILSFPLAWHVLPSAPTSTPCIAFPKTLTELSVTMDKTQLKTTERLCNLVSSLPQNLEFLQFYISGYFPNAEHSSDPLKRRNSNLGNQYSPTSLCSELRRREQFLSKCRSKSETTLGKTELFVSRDLKRFSYTTAFLNLPIFPFSHSRIGCHLILPINCLKMLLTKPATTTSEASKLSHLPIDLLDPITSHLHYLDIANLRFIGCEQLNMKLANGGVSQLTLQILPKLRPFAMPSIFSRLTHLTRFTYRSNGGSQNPGEIAALLAPLSRKLKELVVDCPDVFPSIADLLWNSFEALEILQIDATKQPSYGLVAPQWPRALVSLTFTRPPGTSPSLHLSSLPATLTFLSGECFDIQNSDAGTFPESLTSIRLALHVLNCDPVPLLPSGLKSLELSTQYDTNFGWEYGLDERAQISDWINLSIAKLPRSLTSLVWPEMRFTYSKESVVSLPPKLETLSGGVMQYELWQFLPASITYASACCNPTQPAITKEHIRQLPRGLSHLSTLAIQSLYVESTCNTGVSLTLIRNPTDFSDALKQEMAKMGMNRLPACITSLTCAFLESPVIGLLPTNLVCLILQKDTLEVNMWEHLPQKLERLTLKKLPRNLPVESSTWLPCTLSHFEATSPFGGDTAEVAWIAGLPRGLKSLAIAARWDSFQPLLASNASPASTSHAENNVARVPFPHNLKELTLFFRNETAKRNVYEHMRLLASSLPVALESFQIVASGNVCYSTSDLKALPKRLTKLNLPPPMPSDVENRLLILPRSILHCNIKP